jgi:hypothetical protein
MGLFDKFKKKPPAPTPCKPEELVYVLFKSGTDWEFYKYDPNLKVAQYWNDNNGNGPDKEYDEELPEDLTFEEWPFINNSSTEILTAKEAFPYLI